MISKELSEYVATFKALKTVLECLGGQEFCQHSAKTNIVENILDEIVEEVFERSSIENIDRVDINNFDKEQEDL